MRRTLPAGILLSLLAGSILVSTTVAAPPPLRVDDPAPVEATGPAGASVSYNVQAFDGDTAISASCVPGGSGTGDFTVTNTYPVGSTTVTCTASLLDSSTVSKTITVAVTDTTPPAVTAPGNVTATTTDASGTSVSFPDASATDIVDGSLPAPCDHVSGSKFPLGTTTVTCSATDSHGNTGQASFTVTVTFNDTTAPTFTPNPPPNISQQTSNPGGEVVTYSVSATDDSGSPPTVDCTPASGSTFPVGTTTVNCTAHDAANNSASRSFTVTLTFVDTTPPTFSNSGAMTVEANGPTGSTVNYPTPTAIDNVDGPIAVVTCRPASGSTFPLGTTTVICSATDAHGNTGTASFSVTVVDTTKPSLVVPADRSVYANTPSGIESQSDSVAGFLSGASATDTVDPHPVVTNDAPSFFTIGTHVVTFTARDASGNAVSRTATLDVLPMPAPGTPSPPLPVPPDRKAPPDVRALKADAGDGLVRLSWQAPAGVDHVVVSRSLTVGGDGQVVYTGAGQTFTDRGVTNGLEYRYLVVSVDANGNTSAGLAVVALPKQTLLRAPKDGALLQKPPKLVWLADTDASYYNVQLYRGSVKILSAWPVKTNLLLKKNWRFQGRKYTLTAGVYRWYVWPGLGSRAAANYGEMLGFNSFTILR